MAPVIWTLFANVDTPDTLNCFANKVVPVTVVIPAKVETPATLRLSKFVCPSTSSSTKSPSPTNVVPLNVVPVITPAILTLSKKVCQSTSKS